jgi:hypothetical protein
MPCQQLRAACKHTWRLSNPRPRPQSLAYIIRLCEHVILILPAGAVLKGDAPGLVTQDALDVSAGIQLVVKACGQPECSWSDKIPVRRYARPGHMVRAFGLSVPPAALRCRGWLHHCSTPHSLEHSEAWRLPAAQIHSAPLLVTTSSSCTTFDPREIKI